MTDENTANVENGEQDAGGRVGVIVVSHADYGSAMLRTAEFILGPQSDCCSISVDVAHEVSETVRRLDDAAQRLDKGAGVIVLTDMFGYQSGSFTVGHPQGGGGHGGELAHAPQGLYVTGQGAGRTGPAGR